MNKEQFKKSISEMINFYIGQVVSFNLSAKDAQENQNEALLEMIQGQAQAAGYTFEQGMDKLIDQVFPEDTEEEVEVEDLNDMVE
jgi:hypothetical protein